MSLSAHDKPIEFTQVQGCGMGLQCWAYRVGCLVVRSHQAQIFLSPPQPCRTAALEYFWLTEKKAELTWLLKMMLSHRLENRPFCCSSNLWETRAVQCKGLGNFSFVFDTRPARFVCNLVWQWQSQCACIVLICGKWSTLLEKCTYFYWVYTKCLNCLLLHFLSDGYTSEEF